MTCLFLLCLLSLSSLRAAEENVVIWKLDDGRAGEKKRLAQGFKRVADWAKANDTVVTMGVICNSLATPNTEDVAWIKQTTALPHALPACRLNPHPQMTFPEILI